MAAPATTSLLIIGGAEDKVGRAVVLRRFVRLAGGRRSRIVVRHARSTGEPAIVGKTSHTAQPTTSARRTPVIRSAAAFT